MTQKEFEDAGIWTPSDVATYLEQFRRWRDGDDSLRLPDVDTLNQALEAAAGWLRELGTRKIP